MQKSNSNESVGHRLAEIKKAMEEITAQIEDGAMGRQLEELDSQFDALDDERQKLAG